MSRNDLGKYRHIIWANQGSVVSTNKTEMPHVGTAIVGPATSKQRRHPPHAGTRPAGIDRYAEEGCSWTTVPCSHRTMLIFFVSRFPKHVFPNGCFFKKQFSFFQHQKIFPPPNNDKP